MVPKLGIELEFTIINEFGDIVNLADEIISSDLNNGGIIGELSKSMIEVIAHPGDTQKETFQKFHNNLTLLKDITDKLNLKLVPSSTIGKDAKPISNDDVRQRGFAKRVILGDIKRNLEHHISGTHVHVDKNPIFEYQQLIVFQAMDPLFALMSSTPFFNGNNTQKDYRVDIYRNEVFENFPINGQLLDYPGSIEEQMEIQKAAYNVWLSHAKKKGIEDVGANEFNSIWGPIRLCKKTIESRAADANLFSNVMAWTATYHSIAKFIANNNPEVVIDHKSTEDPERYFKYSSGKLVLPPYSYLKKLENIGIGLGIENQKLNSYVKNIVMLAKSGIEKESFIQPFINMIVTNRSFSDEIIQYAKENGLEVNNEIKDDAASRQIRLYIANRFEEDLTKTKEMIL